MWRQWRAYTRGGRRETKFSPVELAKLAESEGGGEIFLTAINREGTFDGYDTDLLRAVCEAVGLPVIAHGGAGKVEDFVRAVNEGGASAVAAGSMFVFSAKGEGVLISYPSEDELREQFWKLAGNTGRRRAS
jgi:cyclase